MSRRPSRPPRHRESDHRQPTGERRLSRDLAVARAELPAVLGRIVTLVSVAALGAAALAASGPHAAEPLQAAAASSPATAATAGRAPAQHTVTEGRPAPHASAARPAPTTTAAPAPRSTATTRPATKPASARPVRWVPTGTGMWIYQWDHTSGGNARRIVGQAKHVGLSTLYLRVGSSHDGFTGARPLRALLAATRGTGIHVAAWDFPTLKHPRHDAHRLAHAARLVGPGGTRVQGVAPDIETPAEGTFNAGWRVRLYLSTLRRSLPATVSILTAVPWPSRYRIADYPYGAVASETDAFIPMAYWYNNPPAKVTAQSIAYLGRFHKPVQPVGQAYQGNLDVPGIGHNQLNREVPRFFRTAHQHGARAVSLWSWQAAPPTAWKALRQAGRMFPTPRPAHPSAAAHR